MGLSDFSLCALPTVGKWQPQSNRRPWCFGRRALYTSQVEQFIQKDLSTYAPMVGRLTSVCQLCAWRAPKSLTNAKAFIMRGSPRLAWGTQTAATPDFEA